MGRGPNAKGGKFNDKKKTQTTRARFSNWTPNAPKKVPKKLDQTSKAMSSRKFENPEKNTQRDAIPAYQKLILDDSLVDELLGILGEPLINDVPKISMKPVAVTKAPENLPVPVIPPTTKALSVKSNLSSEERKVQNQFHFFESLGFSSDDIFQILTPNHVQRRQQQQPMDYDELFVSLLQSLCNHPTGALIQPNSQHNSRTFVSNAEIDSELEVLESIYGSISSYSPTYTSSSLSCPDTLGICRTELSLFHAIPVTRLELLALDLDGVHVLQIVMFIVNSSQYPRDSAKLYGWLIPQQPNTNPSGFLMKPISPAISRQISLETIRTIHERQTESQAPVLFDFIQNILTECSLNHPEPEPGTRTEGETMKAKTGKMNSTSRQPVEPQLSVETTALASAESLSLAPQPLVRPSTRVMDSSEYREAYLQALNLGLKGPQARVQAREQLQYILPTSAMEALAIEERYANDLAERAFSIENLTTRNIVEGTKLLSERININKSHAKELFVAGKDAVFESGDWYARDLKLLMERCISKAIQIHRERLERKERVRQEKLETREQKKGISEEEQMKVKSSRWRSQRGPTIRDAYGSMVKSNADDQSEENEEGDGDAEDEEPEEISPEAQRQEQERRALESRRLKQRHLEKMRTSKYQQIMNKREILPACQMKTEILQTILANNLVVISGDTGCGKTTQIPQMVLDYCIENDLGADCNMIVTQPRRISAISVAEHISRERIEPIGQTVGYQIRLETKQSAATRLLLMTTGILLRRLQNDLGDVSHLFIDEVHERDINTDFLLVIVRQLLAKRPTLKVILMSATLNASSFRDYFRNCTTATGRLKCAMLSIPGRTFPVVTYFLEDAVEHTSHEILPNSECAMNPNQSRNRTQIQEVLRARMGHIQQLKQTRKYSPRTIQSIERVDESILNLKLIQKLVLHLLSLPVDESSSTSPLGPGAILIFVSGLSDIREVINALKHSPELSNKGRSRWSTRILPLHSSLSTYEQNLVFQICPPNIRKIIVSTNIAETSVTIEDVVYVIDTCRVKENRYDEESQMNVLDEQWISQANARQRRGRAGRVRSGVCYHLACSFTMDGFLDFAVPEMLRMSLEDLILQVLALELGDPYQFLSEALSPPNQRSISNAILYLESLNALSIDNYDPSDLQTNGLYGPTFQLNTEITPLGYHLATLPISPRLGKLLLYSVLLQCVDPMLTIASIITTKSPFVTSFHDGGAAAADEAKLQFFSYQSDVLTILTAYNIWWEMYGQSSPTRQTFSTSQEAKYHEETWCRNNSLSANSLRLIEQMRGQFLNLLQTIGFISAEETLQTISSPTGDYNRYGTNAAIIKCALCCSLSPNILALPPYVMEPLPTRAISSGIGKLSEISLGKFLLEYPLQCKRKDVFLHVHPGSLLSKRRELDSPLLLYVEGMKTSKMYCHDLTTIPAVSLALFSGRFTCSERHETVTIDGWLRYQSNKQTLRCLYKITELLDTTFLEKVLDPLSPIPLKWKEVLRVLSRSIASS